MKKGAFSILILLMFLILNINVIFASNIEPLKNDTGKTIIRRISGCEDIFFQTTFLIISSSGTVLITDPYMMPENLSVDIITVTHSHYDHFDQVFISKNPNALLSKFKPEEITYKDLKVKGIASSHSGDKFFPKFPSNVIYLFEVDGLRIAHMGDIGQSKLTDEQLQQLSGVDIIFMQFENPNSALSFENKKAITIIQQLQPKIIIPTHINQSGLNELKNIMGNIENINDELIISKEDLSNNTQRTIILNNTGYYYKQLNNISTK